LGKLTDKQKKKIIADYIECRNNSEVARMNGVSESTVRRIVKSGDNEEITRLSEQKKQENTQSTIEYMQTQHETKKRILDKILKAIEDKAENIDLLTNIKDLATAYGIILDKELKVLELQKNSATDKELSKVQELLSKIEDEANR
jgi:DNA-binding MurR/RpiR family transcriptional regulator